MSFGTDSNVNDALSVIRIIHVGHALAVQRKRCTVGSQVWAMQFAAREAAAQAKATAAGLSSERSRVQRAFRRDRDLL